MRIRKLRRLNRLSCKELGEIIDISLDSILHLERGVFNPTYTTILKLHNFFGDSIIVDDYSRYVLSDNNIKIKKWRKKNNIKSKDAFKIFNLSERTYWRIERTTHITLRLYKTIKPKLKELGIIS
ncbi:MAG: helix-turn-helix transcriptional regulator [Clostridium sp.]|uniref:helix-turn-helix domain-containing protein n=1 Tax=Clostridium TaxID=1485 RepID=UPI0012B73086|nr:MULTISPECIES: helix-turn-helix transcriptional regulator [Clostridium]MBS6888132.1 helix-turn-helix transcriptional regulator [Clostridium sp.]MDU1586093.1 helix-turn-helix transcriptional regulator [Clostridium sp.]